MNTRVFRDPVHGLIGFPEEDAGFLRVVDTRAMQRLRRIRQMGFASLVYPGAEHSRFGHALGAYHVAQRVVAALALPHEVARDVRAAAMLHDVGHGPYSHAWEAALGGPSHESWGRRIVDEDEELHTAVESIEPGMAARLGRFFAGDYTPRYAKKLVSSQLDVDRMDYLLRDAHYSGVEYSTYDLDWIVHALRIAPVRSGSDGDDLVVDYRRGMHAVEQYLFGRRSMYAQVYLHKTVRAAEWLFLLTLRRFAALAQAGREPVGLEPAAALARGETISVAAYLSLDDARVACALDDWAARSDDGVLRDLAARLCARRLFKTIELGDDPALPALLAPKLLDTARARFGDDAEYYCAIDETSRYGYETRPGEELFVVGHPRHGTVELGELVREQGLGRQVFSARVIAAPELLPALAAVIAAEARRG
ncbi:MAG: HD domain-containing protein [Myxococcales bacterium]|nr:HD domain-containing protein [Myxococcales bacterium]